MRGKLWGNFQPTKPGPWQQNGGPSIVSSQLSCRYVSRFNSSPLTSIINEGSLIHDDGGLVVLYSLYKNLDSAIDELDRTSVDSIARCELDAPRMN